MTRADLGGRADEVVDQRVDGLDVLRPAAGDRAERRALGDAALAADDAATRASSAPGAR